MGLAVREKLPENTAEDKEKPQRETCILLVASAVSCMFPERHSSSTQKAGRTQAQKQSRQAEALGLWAHCSSLQLQFLLFHCTMGIIITQGQE